MRRTRGSAPRPRPSRPGSLRSRCVCVLFGSSGSALCFRLLFLWFCLVSIFYFSPLVHECPTKYRPHKHSSLTWPFSSIHLSIPLSGGARAARHGQENRGHASKTQTLRAFVKALHFPLPDPVRTQFLCIFSTLIFPHHQPPILLSPALRAAVPAAVPLHGAHGLRARGLQRQGRRLPAELGEGHFCWLFLLFCLPGNVRLLDVCFFRGIPG